MPTYVLSGHIIIQQWGYVIENGAGYDKRVIDDVKEKLDASRIPGLAYEEIVVSSSSFFGTKRDLLRITLNTLKDYRMFIGARDVGSYLEVSWFLTVVPGPLKRAISKRAFGSPEALSSQLPLFDHQDLQVWIKVAENCVKKAAESVLEELKQDTSGLSTSSKGFLSVW